MHKDPDSLAYWERTLLDAGYIKQAEVDLAENGPTVWVIFDLKGRTLSFMSSFSPIGSALFTTVYNGGYKGALDETYGIPYKTIMPLNTYLEIKAFKFNPKPGKLLDVGMSFLKAMLSELSPSTSGRASYFLSVLRTSSQTSSS